MGKWKPEYDLNRKRIHFSLNKKEQDSFFKMHNIEPTSDIIKSIILKKSKIEITSKVIDVSKNETNFQLKKLGNNMNQIAWHLNINPNILNSADHKKLLFTIQELNKILSEL